LATAVAGDNQRRETEAPSAFNHRRTALDFHRAIVEIAAT
jgi:hypothetical protein